MMPNMNTANTVVESLGWCFLLTGWKYAFMLAIYSLVKKILNKNN